MGSIVIAAGYAAFQRIGTTANANAVEYTQNLAGGFLAVGMTENQPGFIVLSALDQEKASVIATQSKSQIGGAYTIVDIETPMGMVQTRLRGPQVILVTERGDVENYDVDWNVGEFNILRQAADCSHQAALQKRRCGTPFIDLRDTLATWPRNRVPDRVRTFLSTVTPSETVRSFAIAP